MCNLLPIPALFFCFPKKPEFQTHFFFSMEVRRKSFIHNDDFRCPARKCFEKNVGIGENASYQHVLLFSKCFLHYERLMF